VERGLALTCQTAASLPCPHQAKVLTERAIESGIIMDKVCIILDLQDLGSAHVSMQMLNILKILSRHDQDNWCVHVVVQCPDLCKPTTTPHMSHVGTSRRAKL
jgi:hypothetical protein